MIIIACLIDLSGTYREAQNLKLIGNAAGIFIYMSGSVRMKTVAVYTSGSIEGRRL
ncbi:MAG: hypothetical protein ACLURV_04340 [Gallintestinimicrobium sp.]